MKVELKEEETSARVFCLFTLSQSVVLTEDADGQTRRKRVRLVEPILREQFLKFMSCFHQIRNFLNSNAGVT